MKWLAMFVSLLLACGCFGLMGYNIEQHAYALAAINLFASGMFVWSAVNCARLR